MNEAADDTPTPVGGHLTDTAAGLRPFVGDLRQVCRVERLTHEEGPARGTRLVRMVTGSGMEVELYPDRCLDVGQVTWRGRPIAWAGPAPVAGPAFAEHGGTGWLRTFSGGLLVTCGLDQFGPPSRDGDTELGLHGRASSLPAQHVNSFCAGDDGGNVRLEVSGEMRQARLYGEDLLLRRRVQSTFGAPSFELVDTVTNLGMDPQPHLLLYHLNVGWPLLGEATSIEIPSIHVEPRDEVAAPATSSWQTVPSPQATWQEQVLRHRLPPHRQVDVRVTNPDAELALQVSFHTSELPHLFQWRQFRRGSYVLGIEPANSPVIEGRSGARAAGHLPVLDPGETRIYRLHVAVGDA